MFSQVVVLLFNVMLSKHYSLLVRGILAPLISAVILTFNHRPHRMWDNDYEGSSLSNSLPLSIFPRILAVKWTHMMSSSS